jgi:hypothetical protein
MGWGWPINRLHFASPDEFCGLVVNSQPLCLDIRVFLKEEGA